MHRLWVIILIFLPACQISLPEYCQRQDILSSPCLDESLERSLETPFFSLGHWPNPNWWQMFQSEQLDCFIALALEQNPSLHQAQSRINFARQEAVIARSDLFPLVFFDVDDTWQYLSKTGLYKAFNPDLPRSVSLIDLTLAFTYDFDFWGKYSNLYRASVGRQLAEIAEKNAVELIITSAVAQSYFALKTNLVRKSLYERLYVVEKNTFELQALLQKKALSYKIPTLNAFEKMVEAEKLLANIEAEIAANKHQINILMGLGPDSPLSIDEELSPLPKSIELPSDLSLDLLARRPDLIAQIWRAKALSFEVGAAIADYYPDVSIKAFIGLESVFYSKLFRSSSGTTGVSPALHLPIFTAGAITANVRAHKAEFDEAIFAYNDLLLKSAAEVADLLALAEAIFTEKVEQEALLASVEKRFEITELRRKNGLDSLFSSYEIEKEYLERELVNISLTYNQYVAVIKLIKALGGGMEADLLPLRAL